MLDVPYYSLGLLDGFDKLPQGKRFERLAKDELYTE
jgi:hypothetical protein